MQGAVLLFIIIKNTIMAHNINFNEDKQQYSFFSVKEKAWHNLGQIVQDYPNSREALQFTGLDFEVLKRPNIHKLDSGEEIISTNSFYTYRPDSNAILGDRLGKDYEVVQNIDAFSFFDAIVGGDGIQYETAGALGKGEKIFITAKLPGYIKVSSDDLIEKYLFLTTSHDGFGSIMAAFTPIRIVCNNTLNAALKNCTNSIKIRHTANAKERLEEAHKVLGISNQLSVQMEGIFNQWAKVRITDKEVQKLIQMAMVPNKEVLQNIQNGEQDELSTCFKNMCDAVYEYNMTSPTQQTEATEGTVFGAYNAVTGYFQNVRTYKDDEAKIKSVLYGGTAQLRTQKAFQLCESFVKSELEFNN
jgi:phage/plasmid-like protein (TIGR03299 family)